MSYYRGGVRLFALVLLVSSTVVLEAQVSNRGAIEGLVTDPQGAAIPGLTVAVTSLDTGVVSSTKTSSAGYYRVVDLVPGRYRAHFEATGFSPVDVTDIEVVSSQTIRVDAPLKLGTALTRVEVKAGVPLLETAPANFSTNLETRTITEIPVQGRDLMQLVNLVPGVSSTIGPPGTNFGFNSQYGSFPDPTSGVGSTISVNGGQASANGWLLDGNLNHSGFADNVVVNPSPDAVSEFQTIGNAFSAEYGRTGGAIFNVVLKSGANAFHGNLYEYLRNDATNARNPFTSIDSFGKIIKSRQLRDNNFGGTLGGPVVIPHLYNGKDKTFFFFSFDQVILHLLGQRTFTVPTARMRQGDFSEDINAVNFGIWDPFTTVGPDPVTGHFTRTAFGTPAPGNPYGADGCKNFAVEAGASSGIQTCNFSTQIDPSRFDPVAMFFLNSFPLPNFNSPLSSCPMGKDGFLICDNYQGAIGSSQDTRNISIKIDHNWSEKSRYFAEWLFNPVTYTNYRLPWVGPSHPPVGWQSDHNFDGASQIIAFGNTYTFRPTLVNEFRASFSRQFLNTHPQHPAPDSISGQKAVEQTLAPIHLPVRGLTPIPDWYVYGPGYIPFGPDGFLNQLVMAEAYNFVDNVTKITGKHSFKTGVIYRLSHTDIEYDVPTALYFEGVLNVDPTTGLGGGGGLEQLLLGAPDYGYTGKQAPPYARWRYWGFFAQDDYHLTPRFTLNLGLRYDIYGKFSSRYPVNTNFCFGCINPLTGLKGQVTYTKGDILPPNWNSLGPRINFSWTPFADRKTVIRGGYDIFYSNASDGLNFNGEAGALLETGWYDFHNFNRSWNPQQCAPFFFQCPVFQLGDTTTDKLQFLDTPLTSIYPPLQKDPRLGGSSIFGYHGSGRDPMVQSWSLDIQHELPGNTVIDVGYVGVHGTHLFGQAYVDYNFVHTEDRIKYRSKLNTCAPISNYFSGSTATQLASQYAGLCADATQLPLSELLKPYPFFGPAGFQYYNYPESLADYDGTNSYHGLNVRVQKRFSRGFNFIAAYTVSKQIVNSQIGALFYEFYDPAHAGRSAFIGGRAGTQYVGGYRYSYRDPDNRKADRTIAADDIPQIFNLAGTWELPFGSGRRFANRKGPLNQVVGGWLLSGTLNAQRGIPLNITGPGNSIDVTASRPNLVGDPMKFSGPRSKADRINQWFNPDAFTPSFGTDQSVWGGNYNPDADYAWQFGNAGSRLGGARSPGFWNTDLALSKQFHVTESKYFEFRWESFNALNHMNLGLPNTGWCLPAIQNPDGTTTTDRVHQAGCAFGRITNIQTDPRAMQFALKFFW